MDWLNDRVRRRGQEAIEVVRPRDRFRLGAAVALELGPDAGRRAAVSEIRSAILNEDGQRPEIYRSLTWNALVELASPSLPADRPDRDRSEDHCRGPLHSHPNSSKPAAQEAGAADGGLGSDTAAIVN
jgi:hypothetical protein